MGHLSRLISCLQTGHHHLDNTNSDTCRHVMTHLIEPADVRSINDDCLHLPARRPSSVCGERLAFCASACIRLVAHH